MSTARASSETVARDERGHGRCSAACGTEVNTFLELVGVSIPNNAPDEALITAAEDVFANNNIVTDRYYQQTERQRELWKNLVGSA